MSVVGRMLRQARQAQKISLGTMAERIAERHPTSRFSKSTLSDLERGVRLPRTDELPLLAEVYGLPEEAIGQAVSRASQRGHLAPLHVEPFLELVEDTEAGDHIVVVTQNSIAVDSADLPGRLLKLAARGVAITYVLGVFPDSGQAHSGRWTSNHKAGARALIQEASATQRASALARINYLVVRNPTPNDMAFLRAYDAAVYLRRSAEALEESCAWIEIPAPNRTCWWTPTHYRFQSDLNYWLTRECGLLLPSMELDEVTLREPTERSTALENVSSFIELPFVAG